MTKKQSRKKYKALINLMNEIIEVLPKKYRDTFCEPEFNYQYIPAEWDIIKSGARERKFFSGKHQKIMDALDWVFIFNKIITEDEEIHDKMINLENVVHAISKIKKGPSLSVKGVIQLLRKYSRYYRHYPNINNIIGRIDEKWNQFENDYPSMNKSKYYGLLLSFRSDIDEFKLKNDINIKRIAEEEYNDLLGLLSKNEQIVPGTWSEINFILEIPIKTIKAKDDFAKTASLRLLVDIISASCSGNVWVPWFLKKHNNSIVSFYGTKGEHFKGWVGIVDKSEKMNFIRRMNHGISNRNNNFMKFVYRSVRHDFGDTDYCLRFVRLFQIIQKILGTTGLGAGTRLVWLIEKDPFKRIEIFKKFSKLKKIRDLIIHDTWFYDLINKKQKLDVLEGYDFLEEALYKIVLKFLDSGMRKNDWFKEIQRIQFGEVLNGDNNIQTT